MINYDYLSVSNGSGDTPLMHIQSARLTGATLIDVDTVANVAPKFIGTYGTLGADGKITPATKRDFRGHVSGADLIIDAFEPGSTDNGNLASGQVVIIKPTTGWADRVANWIKNASGNGTPEAATFAGLTTAAISATTVTTSGDTTVGGNAAITGNAVITGTLRVGTATVTTADGSNNITPTKQVYTVTALAGAATIQIPSFATADGSAVVLRIKDDGTSRALSIATGYTNISGLDMPTATTISKWLTIGALYNGTTSKWQILSIATEA